MSDDTEMSATSRTLIQFSTNGNSNTFYRVELCSDEYTVLVKYGRIGTLGVEHRYVGGQKKLEELLKAKRKRGYKEAMIEATSRRLFSLKDNVIATALDEIKCKDDKSKEFVKTISAQNVHKITDATSIVYDNTYGLFKTPLGVVQRIGVERAMKLLGNIEKLLPRFLELYEREPDAVLRLANKARGRKRASNGQFIARVPASDDLKAVTEELIDLNEQYFVIIPNKVVNARYMENLLFSQHAVDEQKSTCNALLETIDLIEDLRKSKSKRSRGKKKNTTFNVEIESVKDKKTLKRIRDMFENSKNNGHGWYNTRSKVVNIFKIKLESQQARFEKCKQDIGNVMELWHGTRTENILSILSKGLLLPKLSPVHKGGGMFGDGLYFANQSTKSLNYCDGGIWNGTSKSNNSYMLLASVAMGNPYTPNGPVSAPPPKGYNSYWAKAGTSQVMNDELIVFSGEQVRLDYILEIDK